MPRYIEGASIHLDAEGEICRDHEAVEAEAINSATDVMRHAPVEPNGVERKVDVRDDAGNPLMRVLASEVIEIHRRPPNFPHSFIEPVCPECRKVMGLAPMIRGLGMLAHRIFLCGGCKHVHVVPDTHDETKFSR